MALEVDFHIAHNVCKTTFDIPPGASTWTLSIQSNMFDGDSTFDADWHSRFVFVGTEPANSTQDVRMDTGGYTFEADPHSCYPPPLRLI